LRNQRLPDKYRENPEWVAFAEGRVGGKLKRIEG
jgi:hypothetical protein